MVASYYIVTRSSFTLGHGESFSIGKVPYVGSMDVRIGPAPFPGRRS